MMFRFFLITSAILVINVMVSYGLRSVFRDRYLTYPGNWLEQVSIQLKHLAIAATDERTRYGLCGLAAATFYLFASSDAMSTEFYVMHFIFGACVLVQSVYATLLLKRLLPGSIDGK